MEKIGENVKIRKIAVTGIVASGKSTVCDILEKKKGAYVIKSDEVVHDLYSQNEEIQKQVAEEFGEVIISDGQIDRKKLAEVVFSDEKALAQLEEIVHPVVIKMIKNRYEEVKNLPYSAFVVEFPLLFEIGFEKWFDKNVVVACDEDECRKRFNQTFHNNSFESRMANQLTQEEKKARADFVIENRGSIKNLEDEVNRFIS